MVTTTGGAPTKALREAAVALTGYRQQEVYGVRAAVPLNEVLPILRARVERVRDVLQEPSGTGSPLAALATCRGRPASGGPGRSASPRPTESNTG